MANNNQVTFIGNLTADPVQRTVKLPDGEKSVTNYDIAVHTGQRTDYFRIASWGKQAENDAKYLKKGNLVMVQGDLQTGSYEKDGVKIPTIQVNAGSVTYLAPANTKGNTTNTTTSDNQEQA